MVSGLRIDLCGELGGEEAGQGRGKNGHERAVVSVRLTENPPQLDLRPK